MIDSMFDAMLEVAENDDRDFYVTLLADGGIFSGILVPPRKLAAKMGGAIRPGNASFEKFVYLVDAIVLSNGCKIFASPVELRRDAITAILVGGHFVGSGGVVIKPFEQYLPNLPSIDFNINMGWLSECFGSHQNVDQQDQEEQQDS